MLARAELAEAVRENCVGRIVLVVVDTLNLTYFSHVLGVLSVKSSMVTRPAGLLAMLTSKKTRGRLVSAMFAVVS